MESSKRIPWRHFVETESCYERVKRQVLGRNSQLKCRRCSRLNALVPLPLANSRHIYTDGDEDVQRLAKRGNRFRSRCTLERAARFRLADHADPWTRTLLFEIDANDYNVRTIVINVIAREPHPSECHPSNSPPPRPSRSLPLFHTTLSAIPCQRAPLSSHRRIISVLCFPRLADALITACHRLDRVCGFAYPFENEIQLRSRLPPLQTGIGIVVRFVVTSMYVYTFLLDRF